ncbi:hypothetical protein I7I51_01527 [Histoplasma capsulatum]|uniref:GPI anchored serine-threonine rich protein n=1 Tax=Ajellomyces capsulatus TaxID=5037 RepID=A0A8A1MEU9_AJECA|nr:hypothetical protein I7I51_01527 [Histoplasma capsulatum]
MRSFISLSAFLTFLCIGVANINVAAADSGSSSKCQAQNILDACLKSTNLLLSTCAVQDWICLCDKYTAILTCYNNCPRDPGRFGVDSAKVANCNAADTLRTTTPVSTLKPTATENTGAASQTSGESTATGTGASSSASATGNAAAGMVVVGGEMGMGGLVWMLLAGIGYLM